MNAPLNTDAQAASATALAHREADRDRDLMRLHESRMAAQNARLAAAKPRPMTGEDVAHEFRQCLIFAACSGVVVVGLLSIGGM